MRASSKLVGQIFSISCIKSVLFALVIISLCRLERKWEEWGKTGITVQKKFREEWGQTGIIMQNRFRYLQNGNMTGIQPKATEIVPGDEVEVAQVNQSVQIDEAPRVYEVVRLKPRANLSEVVRLRPQATKSAQMHKAGQLKKVVQLGELVERRNRTDPMPRCHSNNKGIDEILRENKKALDHIIVDDRHKILFCYVPKVGCSTWKRIMMFLTGKVSSNRIEEISHVTVHKTRFKTLANFHGQDMKDRLESYTKFMFVRHPFERLLSAYRDKFTRKENVGAERTVNKKNGFYNFIENVTKQYREPSAGNRSTLNLKEFITFLLDPKTGPPEKFNEHWRPMVNLCQPCAIRYDFIGRFESFADDSKSMLNRIGVDIPMSAEGKGDYVFGNTAAAMKNEYAKVPPKLLKRLYEMYQDDFRTFGYEWP